MVHPFQDEFIKAIEIGNLAKITELVKQDKELLNIRFDLNPGPFNVNCILTAAYYGQQEIFRFFDENKVDINSVTDRGSNTIHISALGGQKEMIEFLLQTYKDLKIDSVDKNNRSVLHYAAMGGHKDMIEFLLQNYRCLKIDSVDKFGGNILHLVARGNKKEMIEFLLQTNKNLKIDSVDNYSRNVLHYAAMGGHKEMIEFLLQTYKELKIDSIDKEGGNVLHYAAMGGHKDMIEFLCKEKNFSIYLVDNYDRNVLHHAARFGREELVKFLHEHKQMYINSSSKEGTPLYIAEKNNKTSVVVYLKKVGAVSLPGTQPAVNNPLSLNNNNTTSLSAQQAQIQGIEPLPARQPRGKVSTMSASNVPAKLSSISQPVTAPESSVSSRSSVPIIEPSNQSSANINSSLLTIVTQQTQEINELKKKVIELEKNDKQKTDELKKQQKTITDLQTVVESLKESVNTSKRTREDDGQPAQKKARLDNIFVEMPDLNAPVEEDMEKEVDPSTVLVSNNAEPVHGHTIYLSQA